MGLNWWGSAPQSISHDRISWTPENADQVAKFNLLSSLQAEKVQVSISTTYNVSSVELISMKTKVKFKVVQAELQRLWYGLLSGLYNASENEFN